MNEVRLFVAELPATNVSPADLFRTLAADSAPFCYVGSWAGGGALLGSEPVRIHSLDHSVGPHPEVFAFLDELPRVEVDAQVPGGTVGGGWFGYLGYQLGGCLEELNPSPPTAVAMPLLHFGYYDHLLRYDAHSQKWWFEALVSDERQADIMARFDECQRRVNQVQERQSASVDDSQASVPTPLPPFEIRPDRRLHKAALRRCLDHIRAGDIYQANICLRMRAPFDGSIEDAVELFIRGQSRLSPAYACFLGLSADSAIVSFSPELFLEGAGSKVRTCPIKGTAPRPADADLAEQLRDELVNSAKNVAENVMIVDLMRNDLGRVCQYGSVRVPSLNDVQAHTGVWHLVSTVEGKLWPNMKVSDVLAATFPPGSVTGAPKVRAMQIISDLETTAREVYTGSIGYVSALDKFEFNVAIRTFELSDGEMWLGVGGGIVADSDPGAEFEECLTKARPLLTAIGAQWR